MLNSFPDGACTADFDDRSVPHAEYEFLPRFGGRSCYASFRRRRRRQSTQRLASLDPGRQCASPDPVRAILSFASTLYDFQSEECR